MNKQKSTTRRWAWWVPFVCMAAAIIGVILLWAQCRSLETRLVTIETLRRENPNSFGPTTQPVIAGLEVIANVDTFYQNAWTLLLAGLGVGGLIVGVVVPLVVQRLQSESFKESLDEAQKKANDRLDESEKAAIARLAEFDDRQAKAEKATSASFAKLDAAAIQQSEDAERRGHWVTGSIYLRMIVSQHRVPNEEWKDTTFVLALEAAYEFAIAGDTDSVGKTLAMIISELEVCLHSGKLYHVKSHLKTSIDNLREAVHKADMPEPVVKTIDRIEQTIEDTLANRRVPLSE